MSMPFYNSHKLLDRIHFELLPVKWARQGVS
jgi:hypothetical protein